MTDVPDNTYPAEPIVNKGGLPDPFTPPGRNRVTSPEEWPACAAAWRDVIVQTLFGGMPPAPDSIEVETLCHAGVRAWAPNLKNWTYRITCTGGTRPFTFCVQVLSPDSDDPVPAIIAGDGCWMYLTPEIMQQFLEAGCALVIFNRTEMAEDLGYDGAPEPRKRTGGLYEIYPEETFSAIAAWAWGYHRCVDLLQELPFIDSTRVGVTGHSRGGKTTLLAGATDERISLINENASGIGGGAVCRYVGDGGETLDIKNVFPSWFGPDLQSYVDCEEELPFDQHCLTACLAPRHLLHTYALADRWSNPEGMVQCAWATQEVYRFLGAEQNHAFHLREGVHFHEREDWDVLLDFVRWKWFGEEPVSPFNQHPYDHLTPAFTWNGPNQ